MVYFGIGRVCVLIDMDDLDGFDLLGVLMIGGLVNEIDVVGGVVKKEGDDEDRRGVEWERMSIKFYID